MNHMTPDPNPTPLNKALTERDELKKQLDEAMALLAKAEAKLKNTERLLLEHDVRFEIIIAIARGA